MTRKLVCCGAIVVSFFISNVSSFMIPHPPNNSLRVPTTSLQAKQSKASNKGGKGFGKSTTSTAPDKVNTVPADMGSSPMDASAFDGLSSVAGGSNARPAYDENTPVDQRTSSLLRDKYGLRTREEQQEAERRQEAAKEQRKKLDEWSKLADEGKDFDIMEVLPAPVLIGIDYFLKAGLALSTVLFVLAGFGITVEAWSKTTGKPLPDNIDHFIVSVIEPNFTPGLGVLLGFSISLGAFAAAQLNSASSTYKSNQ
jgi:hypothetical protein